MQWQILAKEPAKLAEFYTKLFAWNVDTVDVEGIPVGLFKPVEV